MAYIEGEDRKQLMFPECLDDYVAKDSPVRLFDAFVDSLDFTALGFKRSKPSNEGRPGYDPRDLMKLFIYAYFYAIRSSRKIARECFVNLELMWLINKLTPDFRTISDFRKDNAEAIKKVFKEFNYFLIEQNLLSMELISIDGSKFTAVNSKANNFTPMKLDDKLKRLNVNIDKYMEALEGADLSEEEIEKIEQRLQEFKERKETYEGYQKEMAEKKLSQLSTTDPEAKLMKSGDGYKVSYNCQVASDPASHFVADCSATTETTDYGQLTAVASKVKEDYEEFIKRKKEKAGKKNETEITENEAEAQIIEDKISKDETEEHHIIIPSVSDTGYQSPEDMSKALESGVIPYVIQKSGDETVDLAFDFEENKIDEKEQASKNPANLKKCLRAGIVPEVYKDILEKQEVKEISYYEYEPTGEEAPKMTKEEMLKKAKEGNLVKNTSTAEDYICCPEGNKLHKKGTNADGSTRYSNRPACQKCKNKCTTSEFRQVNFNKDDLYRKIVDKKTKDTVKDPSIKKVEKIKTVVIYTFKLDVEKLKLRMCTSEHPFGTIKRALSGYYFLLKGKIKVAAELALLCLAYNMRRAMNLRSVEEMVAALQR